MRLDVSVEPGAARHPAVTNTDLALLSVILVWGIGYAAFSFSLREIPTGVFNLVRYVVAVPIFWVFLLRSGEDWRLPLRDLPRATATGLVGVFAYSMVFTTASKITHAGNLALLMALSPIWSVLIGWATARTAPHKGFLLGSLVAFAGAATVIASGATQVGFSLALISGDLLAVVSSMIWAWYGIVAQPLLRSHSGLKVQAWINLIALIGFLAYQGPAAVRWDWGSVTALGWISTLYVSLLVTVYAHFVWYTAISRLGPDRVMLAMYLIPAVAATTGAVFLGQPFGPMQIVGAAVALAGVALVRRSVT